MLKKIIHGSILFLAVAGLMFMWGFAANQNTQLPCIGPDINIASRTNNYFLQKERVMEMLTENFDTLHGQLVSKELMQEVHRAIDEIPIVENVKIYRTIKGRLGADIQLRDPLVRIINNDNESFYMDKKGFLFPLSPEYTARVMVATGDIGMRYAPQKDVSQIDDAEFTAAEVIMKELHTLALYIRQDAFLNAFIDHIAVLPDGRFELIPKNGAHTIAFGRAENMEDKFRKLKTFYFNALVAKGWHYYRNINIEYKDQVICSK